ncbi:hypothetical protein AGR9A_Cc70144 [Agrobacterium salinitolerans str. Hayward 0363]|nr:hypothetical protein AGR9A_Cc70144 [Agrobacterium salinitolerans str. Hayward 0363]
MAVPCLISCDEVDSLSRLAGAGFMHKFDSPSSHADTIFIDVGARGEYHDEICRTAAP